MEGLKRLVDPARSAASVVKAILVMTNTTTDTERDVANVGAFTTLDEYDGSNYTGGHGGSGRKTLTVSVTRDDTNDEIELQISGSTTTWTNIGASTPGTRSIQGILIAIEGSASDATAYPIKFEEFASPIVPAGDYVHTWNTEGPIKLSLP